MANDGWIGRVRDVEDRRAMRRFHVADIGVIALDHHLPAPGNVEPGQMFDALGQRDVIVDLHWITIAFFLRLRSNTSGSTKDTISATQRMLPSVEENSTEISPSDFLSARRK